MYCNPTQFLQYFSKYVLTTPASWHKMNEYVPAKRPCPNLRNAEIQIYISIHVIFGGVQIG